MRSLVRIGFAVLAFGLSCSFAHALSLKVSGSDLYLRGEIEQGDAAEFIRVIAEKRDVPIRTVYLQSPGGTVLDGIIMGRVIRKNKLTTVVDADGESCDSACTMLFVGGVKRYYINAEDLQEGLSGGRRGLGFHPANRQGQYSQQGTDIAEAYYRQMGVPGVIELTRQAAINSVFRPNAATALKLRIATGTKLSAE